MEITGETRIEAPRRRVWNALMDPDVLARCIDGVDTLEREGGNRFSGTMNAKVGPVRAKFSGEVEISEADPPHRYVMNGEGKGGVAGFAKGKATVILEEIGENETLLHYDAESKVGGKLAQLGARLVEGAAKGYAERFFQNFKEEVEESSAAAGTADAAAVPAGEEPAGESSRPAAPTGSKPGLSTPGWAGVVILATAGIVAAQLL